MAGVFYDAGRMLGSTAADSPYFAADNHGFPGPRATANPVTAGWEGLRAEMQNLVIEVGDVILDAAQGVRVATEVFDHVDAANGKSILEAHREQWHPDPGTASSPPSPTAEDRPVRPTRFPDGAA
ncbi:hypothetical protein [Actinoplanes sandaracinus]|uniref:hypothetical protein n=1 Tax=Actinoplanes sandaracinus TaxID=3045177 RepID=UPI0024A97DF0|nr:hypothetical protein [Actinoplanes sandaracinus]